MVATLRLSPSWPGFLCTSALEHTGTQFTHVSIQRIEGKAEFVAMCRRLMKRCEKLQMDIHAVARNGNYIFMNWTMTMVFRKFPSTPMYGSTRLTLHEDGRIIEQRDYYDLWGDIFNGVPYFRKPYRSFMRRFFG